MRNIAARKRLDKTNRKCKKTLPKVEHEKYNTDRGRQEFCQGHSDVYR
jgi:hypothetical protein